VTRRMLEAGALAAGRLAGALLSRWGAGTTGDSQLRLAGSTVTDTSGSSLVRPPCVTRRRAGAEGAAAPCPRIDGLDELRPEVVYLARVTATSPVGELQGTGPTQTLRLSNRESPPLEIRPVGGLLARTVSLVSAEATLPLVEPILTEVREAVRLPGARVLVCRSPGGYPAVAQPGEVVPNMRGSDPRLG
jgi:hypothetical protein